MASPHCGGAGNLLESIPWDRRATDRVPTVGTLRPLHHWEKIEDQYELSFIRETPAPVAWRFSTQGRGTRALSGRSAKGAQENILATGSRIFWQRQGHAQTSAGEPKRFAAFLAAAFFAAVA